MKHLPDVVIIIQRSVCVCIHIYIHIFICIYIYMASESWKMDHFKNNENVRGQMNVDQ